MRGQTIILYLLIYLLQLSIISLTSPKITLALLLLLTFCKMEVYFYLQKNWSGQNRSSWTISAGPGSLDSLNARTIYIIPTPVASYNFNISSCNCVVKVFCCLIQSYIGCSKLILVYNQRNITVQSHQILPTTHNRTFYSIPE